MIQELHRSGIFTNEEDFRRRWLDVRASNTSYLAKPGLEQACMSVSVCVSDGHLRSGLPGDGEANLVEQGRKSEAASRPQQDEPIEARDQRDRWFELEVHSVRQGFVTPVDRETRGPHEIELIVPNRNVGRPRVERIQPHAPSCVLHSIACRRPALNAKSADARQQSLHPVPWDDLHRVR